MLDYLWEVARDFWAAFSCSASLILLFILASYAYAHYHHRAYPAGALRLRRRPQAMPPKVLGTLGSAETAEWLNASLDHIFYAAGGLQLVKAVHRTLLTILEEKSSALQSSELRILINRLRLEDFYLGSRLPQIQRVYLKRLREPATIVRAGHGNGEDYDMGGDCAKSEDTDESGSHNDSEDDIHIDDAVDVGDWALVFDVHFDHGSMLTELQATMGLGLSPVTARILGQRLVGKIVVKLERHPSPRVSVMLTEPPRYKVSLRFGKQTFPKVSHVLERVIDQILRHRLLYPHYLTFVLNPKATSFGHLLFPSPANSSHAIVRVKLLESLINARVDLSQLQCSVQIGEHKFKTPFQTVQIDGKYRWDAVHCFSLFDARNVQADFRLVSKRTLLANEVIAQTTLSLDTLPADSLEHVTLCFPVGSLTMEVFNAKMVQSAFHDREWVFWNGAPPPDHRHVSESSALEGINWASIKFVLDQWMSAEDNDSPLEMSNMADQVQELLKLPLSDSSSFQEYVSMFYRAADDYIRCSSSRAALFWEDLRLEDPLEETLRILLADFKLVHLGIVLKDSYELLSSLFDLGHRPHQYHEVRMMRAALTLIHRSDVPSGCASSDSIQEMHPALTYSGNIYNLSAPVTRRISQTWMGRQFMLEIKGPQLYYRRLGHTNLTCFPVVMSGRDFALYVDHSFVWWLPAGNGASSLMMSAQILPRSDISQVSLRRPNVHYLSDKNVHGLMSNLTILSGDTESSFLSETHVLDLVYAGLQPEHVLFDKVESKHLFGSGTAMASLGINNALLVLDAPLSIYNHVAHLRASLAEDVVELRQCPSDLVKEPLSVFNCSFFHWGLVDAVMRVYDEHITFVGTLNKFKDVQGILPLNGVISCLPDSRPLFGKGVKLTFYTDGYSTDSVFLYSINPSVCQGKLVEHFRQFARHKESSG